jgi:hypothetical protein
MKFRLIEKVGPHKVGPHYVGEKVYLPGSVIESDQLMDVKFKGKFERVPDDAPVTIPIDTEFAGMFTPSGVTPKEGGQLNPPVGPPSASNQFLGEKVTIGKQERAKQAKENQPAKKSLYGVDVTDEFPDADLANMKVYHDMKKGLYVVVDPGSNEVIKKAAGDKGVSKFLKGQLG